MCNERWFAGQPVEAELSPVTNFREACCRDYEMGECTRGGFCNFMHLKPISKALRKKLYNRKERRGYNPDRRRGGRSKSRSKYEIFVLFFKLTFHKTFEIIGFPQKKYFPIFVRRLLSLAILEMTILVVPISRKPLVIIRKLFLQ
jgi:hypothetical protein